MIYTCSLTMVYFTPSSPAVMQAATKVSVSRHAVPFPMATVETPCWRHSSVSFRPAGEECWEVWGPLKLGRRTAVSSTAPVGDKTATL